MMMMVHILLVAWGLWEPSCYMVGMHLRAPASPPRGCIFLVLDPFLTLADSRSSIAKMHITECIYCWAMLVGQCYHIHFGGPSLVVKL